MTTELFNPLIPGFNPDPSVTRVGDDFYIVTSTFEYLPGLPIYHSTDFKDWTLIGNVATRPEQIEIGAVPSGLGVFAPTIRHHNGLFHVIVTVPGGRGCIVFTADDAAGPWSEGVVIEGLSGIDPDVVWDEDGVAYVSYSAISLEGPDAGKNVGIRQVKVDLEAGRILSEPRQLWSGSGLQFPEAPHLYRRGNYWYLLIAEGGTERGHAVSIARGTSPEGPFEGGPSNPILSARSTDLPIQNIGHGDLVELPDGSTGMVLLGVRPTGGAHSALGRETFITRVEWVDGWPIAEPVHLNLAPGPTEYTIDFETVTELDAGWLSMRQAPDCVGSIVHGALVIEGGDDTLDNMHPSFIGRRQVTRTADVSAVVDATDATGGLAIRFNEEHHYDIEATGIADGTRITARGRLSGIQQEWDTVLPAGPVQLRVQTIPPASGIAGMGQHERIVLSAAPATSPEAAIVVAELDGRYLSVESAASFTGRVIGIYARSGNARFNRYSYVGSDVL